jgi:hypothetical protein
MWAKKFQKNISSNLMIFSKIYIFQQNIALLFFSFWNPRNQQKISGLLMQRYKTIVNMLVGYKL